ncbi:dTDP-4-dehydrorhamnose reductase [Oleomonas cavernae]|uniref:dTDP-4-dehydrorhamnose reductase n=2 Tax=Oleomonas cavernae TaxID=2320859 RepID=A0A418WHJ2_9PROT|nr:dTDP-4-dehydrorhamnose reductase [Oleomonas cavernae]
MEILVTGGAGQVGLALQRLAWPAGVTLQAPTRAELDLSDTAAIADYLAARPWAAVINAAAYTAVDKAEDDVVAAFALNAMAPAALADATRKAGVPLVHVSTDYVFDGSKAGPYEVEDPVCPIGVYGASKEAGEQAVRTVNPRHAIVRTAWVVSPDRANFVKTMLRLGADRPELRVVADQRGCPTSAADLAQALAAIALRMAREPDAPTGTFHGVNAGEATWCELANHVFDVAARHGRPRPKVTPIETRDYPTPARRPANSRLATHHLAQAYGITLRPWQDAVAEIVGKLVA